MATVSVVVPAYNAAATLEETLVSIRAQTWKDLEIFVVDDGSEDGTAAIANRYARIDSRFHLLSKSNSGVSDARNLGIRSSRAPFVAPCDADDLWHPEKIARQMDRIEQCGSDVGYVYTLSRTIDENGKITGTKGFRGFNGIVYLRSLIINFVGNGSALLVRRAALDDIGGYEPRLRNCDDWHLQAMIARRWKVDFVPQYLTGYRITPRGKSMNHLRMKTAMLAATQNIIDKNPDTPYLVRASAEASQRARLAVVRLRNMMPLAAGKEILTALYLFPRVAIETLVYEEGSRLLRKAVKQTLQSLSLSQPPEPGPHFFDVDPAAEFSNQAKPPLEWLLCELAQMEDEFFTGKRLKVA